jgi:hypothetical protein
MKPENPRHWCCFRAPRAAQSEHQGSHRREGMAVYIAQIDRAACPTAWAEYVEPRCPRDQGGPDSRRPQYVTAGGKLFVPVRDDALRLGTCGSVGNLPLGINGTQRGGGPRVTDFTS